MQKQFHHLYERRDSVASFHLNCWKIYNAPGINPQNANKHSKNMWIPSPKESIQFVILWGKMGLQVVRGRLVKTCDKSFEMRNQNFWVETAYIYFHLASVFMPLQFSKVPIHLISLPRLWVYALFASSSIIPFPRAITDWFCCQWKCNNWIKMHLWVSFIVFLLIIKYI